MWYHGLVEKMDCNAFQHALIVKEKHCENQSADINLVDVYKERNIFDFL